LTVGPAVSISTSSLPAASVGVAYTTTLVATGGTAPYAWSATGITIGSGVALDSATGILSGTPVTTGSWTLGITVTDAQGKTKTVNLTLTATPPLEITTASLPQGQVSAWYSITLVATGGSAPYTWSATGITIMTGVWLDPSTGVFSGYPGEGSWAITFTVTDAQGRTATKRLLLTAVAP
jgi:heme exporter protein D